MSDLGVRRSAGKWVAPTSSLALGSRPVSSLELRPFAPEFLPDAGRLLARRHSQQRAVEPLLSRCFEDPAVAEQEIAVVWKSEGASGAVALVGRSVVGYVLGAPKPSAVWGPNVWVEAAGHAVDDGEVARDLYGLAAARWVDEGRTAHYAIVPAHDRALLDAWYRLGFGQQQMHAIQSAVAEPFDPPTKVVIRRAERADIPTLAALDLALPQHQATSPVFSAGSTSTLEEAVAEWEEDFGDPDYAIFVAERGGVVVGSAIGCSIDKSSSHAGLSRPDNAGFLGFAAVFPEHRGLGAGRALGESVIWWSTEAGYASVVTDWRVTNLLSSRTWPALGFHDTFVRVHRAVGY
jgi:GNAT superfamily N-acetyltransferase